MSGSCPWLSCQGATKKEKIRNLIIVYNFMQRKHVCISDHLMQVAFTNINQPPSKLTSRRLALHADGHQRIIPRLHALLLISHLASQEPTW